MNFQSIIGFFTSPLGFIIIVGAISTFGRMIKSAQEQQAKKRAIAMRRQADQDSLRTGVRADSSQAAPMPLASSKNANWDNNQQLRRDRIEELRNQRVDQLKKLREQRSGGSSPMPVQSSTPVASPRQRPVQPIAQAAPRVTPPRATPRPAPVRAQQPIQQPVARQSRVLQQSSPKPIAKQPPPRQRARPAIVSPIAQQQIDESRRISRTAIKAKTNTPIMDGSITKKQIGSSSSIRDFIRTDLKRAMVAKEVLSQPLGLRSPDADPMGIV